MTIKPNTYEFILELEYNRGVLYSLFLFYKFKVIIQFF